MRCDVSAVFVSFRMDMVHLPGKGVGGRRIPLLLTRNVVEAMELLAKTRNSCGIPTTNVYFCATPSANNHIDNLGPEEEHVCEGEYGLSGARDWLRPN